MSNYMECNMTVKNFPVDLRDDLEKFIYNDRDGDLAYVFDAGFTVEGTDICFWGVNMINHGIDQTEMVELSKAFPDALFILEESAGYDVDITRYYWKNGKVATYEPEIVWPEYNSDDLMEVVTNAD